MENFPSIPKLLLIGGFLGAGKTALLWKTARHLGGKGYKVGLITNDQAPGLVDTMFLSLTGTKVHEITGDCFCCNFPGFVAAIQSLMDGGAEFIIAEPIGSCADLSATVLQPLKEFHPELHVVPFTVLVDPCRLRTVLEEDDSLLHEDASYIFRQQIEEGDRVLLNKIDRYNPDELNTFNRLFEKMNPGKKPGMISALTGEGLDEWLTDILSGAVGGKQILKMDYERYARGEAVLGWVNMRLSLRRTAKSAGWKAVCYAIMDSIYSSVQDYRWEVGHIKLILTSGKKGYLASLTGLSSGITTRFYGDKANNSAHLIFNARVQCKPEELEKITNKALEGLTLRGIQVKVLESHALSPDKPSPTHRFEKPVEKDK